MRRAAFIFTPLLLRNFQFFNLRTSNPNVILTAQKQKEAHILADMDLFPAETGSKKAPCKKVPATARVRVWI